MNAVTSSNRGTWPTRAALFGVPVSVTTYAELSEAIVRAAQSGHPARVTALAVHGLMTAASDATFCHVIESFDAVAPDGQPVAFALNRLHHAGLPGRVRAVDLTIEVLSRAARLSLPVYLFGSREEVVSTLRARLGRRFEGLRIVGSEPGLYRPLAPGERDAIVARVNRSGAKLLLLGMGCPHQERFAHTLGDAVTPVQMCVGSVFDVLSGTKPEAPGWMRRHGLEWLFRLCVEPRRLWRRYLVTNTQFVIALILALLRRNRP